MQLISDEYREMNAEMHRRLVNYGNYGSRWAETITRLAKTFDAVTILDYGCGKGTLAQALAPRDVAEYDPAIPGKDSAPAPADLVSCTDVMEHIEPSLLENVLCDLQRLTLKVAFLNISTRKAAKSLADGRNAHLIVQDDVWWRQAIERYFRVSEWAVDSVKMEVNCVLLPLEEPDAQAVAAHANAGQPAEG